MVSSPRCRRERTQSWSRPGRTTYHQHPYSSEDLQSPPADRDKGMGGHGGGGGDKARDRKCFTNVGYYVIQVMVKVILLYYRRNMISRCFVASLTLHPDTSPPPAQIMVSFTTIPHQSLCLHTLFPTTGSRACCSLSGMGPWARTGQGGFS